MPMTPEQERERVRAAHNAAMRPARWGGGQVAPPKRPKHIGRAGPVSAMFDRLREHGVTPTGLRIIGRDSSQEWYARAMRACRACPHATVTAEDRVFCECVGCRRWRMDMEEQNRSATSVCPRVNPAFIPEHIPDEHKWRWGIGG